MSQAGVARCLMAAALFGGTAPAASRLAGTLPAATLAGLAYLGALIAVLPSVLRRPPGRSALIAEWRPAATAVILGGAAGPVLLMAGLAHTSAASASLLLNTELVATVVLAAVLFREHLGGRVIGGVLLISAAAALLTWTPGGSLDVGALLVVAACACWGIDNCVTARIEHLSPEHVVMLKGAVAGTANLALGLSITGLGSSTGAAEVLAALAIGAAGYGWSITLWVKGARDLGAARAQLIFAAAPFIGAVAAWIVLGEPSTAAQLASVPLAVLGVLVALRSAHDHLHRHEPVLHDHEHLHDEHHDHVHDDGFTGRHAHPHRHEALTHAHPHVPDLHHRHRH